MTKGQKQFRNALVGYSFLLPNISIFLVFTVIPVFMSLYFAFTDWDLYHSPHFIGVANFARLIHDRQFWQYLLQTFYFMLGIPLGMIVSFLLAVLVNQEIKGVVVFRVIYFLPVVSMLIAVALLWRWMYNPTQGFINIFLQSIGISRPPNWLNSGWAIPAIIIFSIWKSSGYNMLLYLAALQGIPTQLYEAADMDGANGWNKFWNVTLPLLAPTNFFILIMSIINGFQNFGEIYSMTNGGPQHRTTTIVFYIYELMRKQNEMGYASAVAWFLFILIFIATLLQFKSQKGITYQL